MNLRSFVGLVLASVFTSNLIVSSLFAQPIPPIPRLPLERQSRMPVSFQKVAEGLQVVSLDEDFPQVEFVRIDPSTNLRVAGALEVGDVVKAVDGQPVNDVFTLFSLMKSYRNRHFTIRDVRNNLDVNFWATPRQVHAPILSKPAVAQANARVFVVHVVDTDDPKIGNYIKVNIGGMEQLFDTGMEEKRLGEYVILQGADCNVGKLLQTINNFQMSGNDTLFVYFQGHGAFSQEHSRFDVSGGHCFKVGNNWLLRSALARMMLGKRARMTILVSDCCNVRAAFDPERTPVHRTRITNFEGWTILEDLLFCHCGFIDITSASRGDKSWCTPDLGSWFTSKFIEVASRVPSQEFMTWQHNWFELKNRSEAYFQQMKLDYPNVSELQAQSRMSAHEYALDIERQFPPDTPTGQRQHIDLTTLTIQRQRQ